MTDTKVVRRLLASLEQVVGEIEADATVDLDAFLADRRCMRAMERNLEIAAQCCMDIGSHIISDDRLREPDDYADIFSSLREGRVIARDLEAKLRAMAKFRNLLAHMYAKVEPAMVHSIGREGVADLLRYYVSIHDYLEKGPIKED